MLVMRLEETSHEIAKPGIFSGRAFVCNRQFGGFGRHLFQRDSQGLRSRQEGSLQFTVRNRL
jgi:hypothetical protein